MEIFIYKERYQKPEAFVGNRQIAKVAVGFKTVSHRAMANAGILSIPHPVSLVPEHLLGSARCHPSYHEYTDAH